VQNRSLAEARTERAMARDDLGVAGAQGETEAPRMEKPVKRKQSLTNTLQQDYSLDTKQAIW